MLHDPADAGSADSWLLIAKSDLSLAKINIPEDVLYDTLCFHAQQAAEKSLKAILVHFGIRVPKTHSIESLINEVAVHVTVPVEVANSSCLTIFAAASRYPGDYEPLSKQEYEEMLAKAEQVFTWAEAICKSQQRK